MKSICDKFRVILLAVSTIALLFASSCMKERPDELPEELVWNPELAFPLGEEHYGLNHVSGFDTTLFDPDTLSGLPRWLSESELHMEGILDFDLSSITDNLDGLNRILFRVNCYNQFPHTVLSQAYFQDASLNIIDSLFRNGPVETPPGQVSENGASSVTAYSRHDAIIEGEGIQELKEAVSILFLATILIEELDSSLIPLYPNFNFDINTGLMLDLSLEY